MGRRAISGPLYGEAVEPVLPRLGLGRRVTVVEVRQLLTDPETTS
jgi:hypothetical protein